MTLRLPWQERYRLTFPDTLPIYERIDAIRQALAEHQVIVVAGATGSGKTTQLPKIALSLGLGCRGRIGHTQPRRVAARSVAARLAEELGVELGQEVGYQVRFSDHIGPNTYVKLMTDGILLAELKHDRLLKQYDTLIIDEAHERSLNIDFLLGYLKRLLPKRPDLKVIITSATLDHQRFAEHFGAVPVLEVEGRTFPVEIRYRPIDWHEAEEDLDVNQAIYRAVQELWQDDPRGDILVFLSGERAIRDALAFLKKQSLHHTELLPLFARLSTKEQQAIFSPQGQRRIILATNIAETSLTVPGIKYVIDTGVARVKRYSYRSKIQRLPIEAIAQANAAQRAGRCGRTSPGVCIRLYSEQDFALRPLYTEAEILRSNLAAVLLQMSDLGLGTIDGFPLLDPPDSRLIRDGEQCLMELGAFNASRQLTKLGRELLAFPLDPRLSRILIEANRRKVLPVALIVVAALSCQDVRDRPMDKAQAADQAHQSYRDERSDFVTLWNIWRDLQDQQRQLTNRGFRDYCRHHYLSYLRFKDWQDVVSQLQTVCRQQWPNTELNETLEWHEAAYAALHKAILSGFVSQIIQKLEQKEYLGTRSRKLQLFPGSGLFKKNPAWLVCAEMVETAKLYARQCAAVEPEWVCEVAPHLVKKTYGDAQFDAKRGEVYAFEKVLLFGLTLIPQRRVSYARIDADEAHRVFVREALAEQRYDSRLPFYRHNQALFNRLKDIEDRTRDSLEGLPVEALYEFFAKQVPSDISDVRSFETWYKQASLTQSQLLCLDDAWLESVMARHSVADYPSTWRYQDSQLVLSYQFAPGTEADGVSMSVPMLLWRQLPKARLAWLVPGLLEAKIAALFKHLPKSYRRSLPSDAAQKWRWRDHLAFGEGELHEALRALVQAKTGLDIPLNAWLEAEAEIPEHLRFYIQLLDGNKIVARGRDFALLDQAARAFSLMQRETFTPAVPLTVWPADERLPEHIQLSQGGVNIPVYIAWQAVADGVVKVQIDHLHQAKQVHRAGILKWLQLALSERLQRLFKQYFQPVLQAMQIKGLQHTAIKIKAGVNSQAFFELHRPYLGNEGQAWQDFCDALLSENFAEDFWAIRDRDAFDAMVLRHQSDLTENASILSQDWQALLERFSQIRQQLRQCSTLHPDADSQALLADMETQLQALIYPGCFAATPYPWRERLAVYLQGMAQRLQKCFSQLASQRQQQREVHHYWQLWQQLSDAQKNNPLALDYRFMVEEFCLSLFAPSLKTLKPVSAKRLTELYGKLQS